MIVVFFFKKKKEDEEELEQEVHEQGTLVPNSKKNLLMSTGKMLSNGRISSIPTNLEE